MAKTIITLEDKGQDFTKIICDENGVIVETQPFQTSIWKNGVIPIQDKQMMAIGKPCPIHHPPSINFGFLNYKIEKIEKQDD